MDLISSIADFKLLSKKLKRHGNIMSVYDYFILDDTPINQKHFFMSIVCETLFKKI